MFICLINLINVSNVIYKDMDLQHSVKCYSELYMKYRSEFYGIFCDYTICRNECRNLGEELRNQRRMKRLIVLGKTNKMTLQKMLKLEKEIKHIEITLKEFLDRKNQLKEQISIKNGEFSDKYLKHLSSEEVERTIQQLSNNLRRNVDVLKICQDGVDVYLGEITTF